MKKIIVLSCVLALCKFTLAQEPYIRLGQKAMMNSEFSIAAGYFEKAYESNTSDVNALWYMGYSYFHANEYKKSILSFDKLINLKPTETIAYYYRGKAKSILYTGLSNAAGTEKEKLIKGAIKDFSIGLEMSPNDLKFYQNRGLAYLDLAIFKSQKLTNIYSKSDALSAANLSVKDFQKLLVYNNGRSDILNLVDKANELIQDIQKL